MKPKFKVGDKVEVINDIDNTGIWVFDMYVGKTGYVTSIEEFENEMIYELNGLYFYNEYNLCLDSIVPDELFTF